MFLRFFFMVKVQFQSQIRVIQTMSVEFVTLTSFFHQCGVNHRYTCPYTSKHNGVIECWHHCIMDKGPTIMH